MSLTRPAVILLAVAMLLLAAGVASAASSQLTPVPPATLTGGQPTPASQAAGAQSGSSSPQTVAPLPRTGVDTRLQLALAALLIASGAALRTRRPAGRG